MSPTAGIFRTIFARTLQDQGPALTLARLLTSRHLGDLQWIATMATGALAGIVALCMHQGFEWVKLNWALVSTGLAAVAAVVNWTYQSGNRRIGAVDLFACEISVICRVTLVVDFARSYVVQARVLLDYVGRADDDRPGPQASAPSAIQAPKAGQSRFTSEEHYTPVYDNELSDLVPLDVNVVTHVTEFYTYRKTMMDYLRALAVIDDAAARSVLMNQMLYMQYLMFESGRLAIGDLVEFEPNRDESIINVLCSELVLYGYLRGCYCDDYRGDRLILRIARYRQIMCELDKDIADHDHVSWSRAKATWPELKRRYFEMCDLTCEEPDVPFARP